MTKQENTAMLNRLYHFMHERVMVIDGIEGKIVFDTYEAKYPYPHTVRRLQHCPTAKGRATQAYKECKTYLRDDWTTDLLASEKSYEAMCAEAERLGFWEMEALHKEVG